MTVDWLASRSIDVLVPGCAPMGPSLKARPFSAAKTGFCCTVRNWTLQSVWGHSLSPQRTHDQLNPLRTHQLTLTGNGLSSCTYEGVMDIARPELKRQKRRRQILWASVAVAVLIGVTVGISRLKPAAPTVDRSTIWTDTVKRGSMLRQVRGLGSLIPSHEDVRQIPAETEATVIRIVKLPGSQVEPDTVLVEMRDRKSTR